MGAEPLAVWIGELSADDAVSPEGIGLHASTVAPAQILRGSLGEALAASRAERVLLLPRGHILAPLALERFGQAAALAPEADVITCDEDGIDESGRRGMPRFRPGPSPDRWLACDDSGATLVVGRAAAAEAVSTLGRGGGWRHELALALAGPGGTRAAHVPFLLSHRRGAEEPKLAVELIAERLAVSEPGARVESLGDVRRVRRPLAHEPIVEVVVCFRDRPELLERCVDSLLAVTAYDRLQVALVDNGSVQPATRDLVGRLAADERVRIVSDPRPFNFAALNNRPARDSAAEMLVFLNNDTEIVDATWLLTLLEEAARPEVGAVAPLLLYPDQSVQHAGVALGLHDYAGHPFAGLAPGTETPFGRADGGTRNWLAVTAACMMVERSKFLQVGGFDESFVVAGNDVDLCLRLTAAGYRSLCVPHAVVVHDESRSRGSLIDPADFVRSRESYGEFRTVGDPFYNPNLTLQRTDCGVRTPGDEAR